MTCPFHCWHLHWCRSNWHLSMDPPAPPAVLIVLTVKPSRGAQSRFHPGISLQTAKTVTLINSLPLNNPLTFCVTKWEVCLRILLQTNTHWLSWERALVGWLHCKLGAFPTQHHFDLKEVTDYGFFQIGILQTFLKMNKVSLPFQRKLPTILQW